MKKILRRSLLIGGITLLVVGTITPIVVTTIINNKQNSIINKTDTNKYKFNDEVFNSRNELYSYAREIATSKSYNIKNNFKWSIEYQGQTKYFSNINDLFSFLENKIAEHSIATSSNFSISSDNSIDYSELSKLNINDNDLKTIDIYRGKDNSYYTSEIDAKNSYLQIHDAYLFNDIHFRTKEELKAYLELNYDSISDFKNQNIVVKSPLGNVSTPINLKKIKNKDQEEINKFTKFVNTNYKKYIQLEYQQGEQTKYNYFDSNDIYSQTGDMLAYFDKPTYVSINSNQGNSNYLIDLKKEDEFDLFGPYYTKGSTVLMNITDVDCWSRVEGDTWGFNDNQKIVSLLTGFMDILLEESNNSRYLFGLYEIENETRQYFDYLNYKNPYVYNQVMNLYNTMKNGKRYSPFYKLPILYIKTLEELIYTCSDQNLIEITNQYYKKVAQTFDNRLYSIVPSNFLEPKNSNSMYGKLSFEKLFKIGDPSFDLNTDIEAFVDIVDQEYPNFINYIDFAPIPTLYAQYIPGALDYDSEIVNYVNSSFNGISSLKNDYSKAWDILNTYDKNKFSTLIKTTFKENTGKDISNDLLNLLLSQYVLPKEVMVKNVERNILEDIQKLDRWGVLSDIPLIANSFFNDTNTLFKRTMLDLYRKNNKTIDYKTFVLLKIEYELNPKSFIDSFGDLYYYEVDKINRYYRKVVKIILKTSKEILTKTLPYILGPVFSLLILGFDDKMLEQWNNSRFAMEKLSQMTDALSKIKDALESADIVIDQLSSVFKSIPYINVALMVMDFIIPKTTKFSYQFEAEGVKYIWNGGSETSMMFGLVNITSRDIQDMKINTPIQVTKQHINNAYYYNGKEYLDLQILKRDQLFDILNGRFKYNDTLKQVYTFDKLGHDYQNKSPYAFDSIGKLDFRGDDLIDDVYERLITKDPWVAGENVYTYANGFTFDENQAQKKNIEDLVSKIKPVKIAMTPTLQNNMPIYKNDNSDDGTLPTYKLPGKSWTSSTGFSYNENENYIVVDPNQEDKIIEPVSELKELFYKKFDVQSKTILENDLHSNQLFSEYQTNINYFNIYEVKLDNGYRKYFYSKSDTLKWYMQQCNFTAYSQDEYLETYTLGNNIFNSLDEYLKWVLDNSEVIWYEKK